MDSVNRTRLTYFLGLGCGLTALVSGHPDDPKVIDLEAPYEGVGWRSGMGPLEQGYPSERVTLRSWLPLPELKPGAVFGNDCWGYTAPSGREYALMGVSNGTVIVEITDPDNPQIIERLDGPDNLWHDIKTYGPYAYAVSEGGDGVRIIDLTQVDAGVVTQTTRFGNATHNVAINTESGRMYRCGGVAFGTFIYSLADPLQPVRIGEWTDSYVHDAQVVTWDRGAFAGREIMFACTGSLGMQILDVTDPQAVTTISAFAYPGTAYAHQCWLSPDRRYLYIGDEIDESTGGSARTYIYNVEDLGNPIDLGRFSNDTNATDHNLYTRGTLIYEANYRTGLRVFDATDPEAPVEVAYFDTYPTDDGKQLNGLWSNYPYFPSGTIIGSDMQRGLFVFTLDAYPLSLRLPDGNASGFAEAGSSLRVEVVANVGGAEHEGPPLLYIDAGEGFVATPLTGDGLGGYLATLPEDLCDQTIRYYFEVTSSDGYTSTSPVDAPNRFYETFLAGTPQLQVFDDLETPDGWVVDFAGNDTATSGVWAHGDPLGSPSEPGSDVSAFNATCWHTGQGVAGDRPGDHDVDGGRTTLVSPALDASGLNEPTVAYWRWFSNDRGGTRDDRLTVQISNDDGGTWTLLERVAAESSQATGGWYRHQARIRPLLEPSATMRLRFLVGDEGEGSRVEAAIDDVQLIDLRCLPCPEDIDGDGQVGLAELSRVLTEFGERGGPWGGDVTGDERVDLDDLATILSQFGLECE